MRNIKLTLEYDGSEFFGFQRQNDRPTIQSELEKALSTLFNRPMKIAAAAGRTDSGVHAKAQVVNFKTDSLLPLDKIQKGLNALLPKAIAVKKVEEALLDFHARYSAKWKIYEYLVLNSKIRSPLLNGRVFQCPHSLALAPMRKAARKLVGRHDFKTFSASGGPASGGQASGSNVKDTVRFIRRLTVSRLPSPQPRAGTAALPSPLRGEGRPPKARFAREARRASLANGGVRGKLIRFVIEADGFLYHMVRSIVGTLLEVGRGSLSLQDFSRLVKKRRRSIHTVPPQGLTLASIEYK